MAADSDPLNGQSSTVLTGKVSDAKSQPLPGFTVLIKGTSNGTTTDTNGAFRLTISSGKPTLVVSYVGYISQEVIIDNQSAIDIRLAPANKTLNEIVVVGYGTQQKKDLTGSVASVAAFRGVRSKANENKINYGQQPPFFPKNPVGASAVGIARSYQ